MLDRKELKEIAQMRDDVPSFVSLYLNVNPLTNPRGEFIILFKNLVRNTIESLDKGVHRLVKEDLEKIETVITGNKSKFKKGLAILSSTRKSLGREYNLSVPVKSELVVDKCPYLKPLFDIIENYQRYAVLLVDKESARIFMMHLGEIVEYGEVHTPDVPGRHKKGGWFALSQSHYERHIDYHVSLHLKDVIKKLDSFISGEEIGGLVIGGSEEAMTRTREMLPATVVNRIVGTFSLGMFANINEILSKVTSVIHASENHKKTMMVDRLITQALKNENAVIGLEDVLNALQEGKVMRLVSLRDLSASGYECRKCRFLGVRELSECPYCKGDIGKSKYLIDLVVQKAVEQGAPVEVVAGHQGLSEAGGIGAFLRF
jgi:peptide chain release factor subunit 1